jgi:hypothetical protein
MVRKMKFYYILRVIETYEQEEYTMFTLLYDNVDDYNEASEVVKELKLQWYEDEITYSMAEFIEEGLDKRGLLGLNNCVNEIRV